MANKLVEVQNLKQYFPVASGLFKKSYVKAVDNVSFSSKTSVSPISQLNPG